MKRKIDLILFLLVMLVFLNVKAQNSTDFHIDSVFKQVNNFISPTGVDTLYFNDLPLKCTSETIIKNWQDSNEYYFEAKEIDKMCYEIAFAEILRNKMSSYLSIDTIKSYDYQQISSRVITDHLSSIKEGGRMKPITGTYLESFDYDSKKIKIINKEFELFKDKREYKTLFKRSRCQFGYVQIDSNVEGCTIIIDNRDTEITTNKKLNIPVGDRQIMVVKDGYTNCVKIVKVKKRQHYEITCVLEKL